MPAVTPWLAVLTPFVMPSPDHFRPGGPPALNSAAYASDFEEVKRLGRATGSSRTPEQTVIAFFWTDNTFSHWNRIAVSLALQRRTRLSENARLFALLNIAMADAGIAVWDAKFLYRLWRPFSAIPLAETDGNAATAADAGWTSSARDAESPGISVRSRRPQRCGGPRARPYLRRQNHVHAPD